MLLMPLLLLVVVPLQHAPLLATTRRERAVMSVPATVLRPRSVRRAMEEGSMMMWMMVGKLRLG